MNSNLEIIVLKALSDNFVYVLRASNCKEVTVIDPSTFDVVDEFLKEKGWGLSQILCTHHHHDHVGGAFDLSKKYLAPIICSQYDFARIKGAQVAVNEGDAVKVGEHQGEVLLLPGHTLGHWGLFWPSQNWLFVGDVLFSAGCGKLFEGTPEQMFNSFNKIKSRVNEDTKIWFGHEYTLRNLRFVAVHYASAAAEAYQKEVTEKLALGKNTCPTTFKTEMQVNPMLRAKSAAEFKKIRELRDQF